MTRPTDAQCWRALVARDAGFDGRFFFGVVTTGVFCRPSCKARRPRRENVRFYATRELAASDGLRPCRRCRPAEDGDPKVAKMRSLCDEIRQRCTSGETLTLAVLAVSAGMSPSHLQRTFRTVVGVTPRQYVEACRLEALKGELRAGVAVTDAVYEAGFGSSSRVYERVDSRLGMTPGEVRTGGDGVAITYALVDGPVGRMLVAATDRGLCAVELGDADESLVAVLRRQYPAAEITALSAAGEAPLAAWIAPLKDRLADGRPSPELPLDVRASAFRFQVWRTLQAIPQGEVRSYGAVAAALGRPTAARAVAQACAANRLALVVPCHRVIRGDGELGGYRWGPERKRRLLEREGAVAAAPR